MKTFHSRTALSISIVAVTLLAGSDGVVLAEPGRSMAQSGQSGSAQPSTTPMNATAGEIAANPAKYYGKKVIVRAEIEDVLGGQMFLLDEDRLFAWPDVIVITPALGTPLVEDSIVTVTGMVRAYVDADFRRDYDWNWWDRLDPDLELTFRNRPAIVADSVKTEQGNELVRK